MLYFFMKLVLYLSAFILIFLVVYIFKLIMYNIFKFKIKVENDKIL